MNPQKETPYIDTTPSSILVMNRRNRRLIERGRKRHNTGKFVKNYELESLLNAVSRQGSHNHNNRVALFYPETFKEGL